LRAANDSLYLGAREALERDDDGRLMTLGKVEERIQHVAHHLAHEWELAQEHHEVLVAENASGMRRTTLSE